MDEGRKHHSKKQLFLPPPAPPPGQHCREAENTVKNSTKCTISSVSAREHPVGGNFQQNYYSFTQLSAFEAFDWPTRSGWRLFLNIGMEYVKIIKAETLNLMINSYYLNNILWSTHLPKHKHKARTTPTIIPSRWHITWAPNLPPNPTWKKHQSQAWHVEPQHKIITSNIQTYAPWTLPIFYFIFFHGFAVEHGELMVIHDSKFN